MLRVWWSAKGERHVCSCRLAP